MGFAAMNHNHSHQQMPLKSLLVIVVNVESMGKPMSPQEIPRVWADLLHICQATSLGTDMKEPYPFQLTLPEREREFQDKATAQWNLTDQDQGKEAVVVDKKWQQVIVSSPKVKQRSTLWDNFPNTYLNKNQSEQTEFQDQSEQLHMA